MLETTLDKYIQPCLFALFNHILLRTAFVALEYQGQKPYLVHLVKLLLLNAHSDRLNQGLASCSLETQGLPQVVENHVFWSWRESQVLAIGMFTWKRRNGLCSDKVSFALPNQRDEVVYQFQALCREFFPFANSYKLSYQPLNCPRQVLVADAVFNQQIAQQN